MDLEIIKIILQVITIVIMIFGLIVAIRKLILLANQVRNQYAWDRRKHALTYSLSNNERLRRARVKLDEAFGLIAAKEEALTLQEIDEAVEKDKSLNTDIVLILAHWENLALSIKAKISDEKVAFEMVAGLVISYVRVLRNFIDRRRKVNPRAYDYLIKLSGEWDERLRNMQFPDFSDLDNV